MNDRSRIELVRKVVSEKLGLHFPESKFPELSSGLQMAAKELGFKREMEAFISLVIDQKLSGEQLDILAEKLTIGETYFYREKKILSAFREIIIPSLVKERETTTRSIRIWSAGCCSGEEPYTLAMILSEIIPNISSWNIMILATDINRRFLTKATTGIFTPWSFRETPVETQNRYFTPVGRNFEISPLIRTMVRFQPLNLVEDPFPSGSNNTHSMDVIFCRNVLMYFSPETAKALGEKFYHSLTDRGWFITSQVELSDVLFHLLTKVNYQNSFLYRKIQQPVIDQKKTKPSGKKRSIQRTVSIRSHPSDLLGKAVRKSALFPIIQPVTSTDEQKSEPLTKAREFANRGDFNHAFQELDKLSATMPSNPEAFYLLGMILFEQGDLLAAEQNLKKALYLDPDHLLAHFQMATLCLRAGKKKQAGKHRQNVADLLQKFGEEDLLPGSEGMTAGNLRNLITSISSSVYDR